ncbi:hypothetical protein BU24DRAFT_253554 [Aaosphaeria arxii CBS 175.79]|uniref:Uncharacterized protein n=1 Tax=Aaosphaeria arxii CBS 175.79 TaxID=1450172 RepID=A0A6A5XI84_9PLEO|nr:uncharacterized protein BU24DRAFT_253554 [Aaosphaeria arxii CBS 175.79]KAF2012531.1 hypothetical protein BU24DRAFT_253554 [Aaosphaeria arxii CBS 175.79]
MDAGEAREGRKSSRRLCLYECSRGQDARDKQINNHQTITSNDDANEDQRWWRLGVSALFHHNEALVRPQRLCIQPSHPATTTEWSRKRLDVHQGFDSIKQASNHPCKRNASHRSMSRHGEAFPATTAFHEAVFPTLSCHSPPSHIHFHILILSYTQQTHTQHTTIIHSHNHKHVPTPFAYTNSIPPPPERFPHRLPATGSPSHHPAKQIPPSPSLRSDLTSEAQNHTTRRTGSRSTFTALLSVLYIYLGAACASRHENPRNSRCVTFYLLPPPCWRNCANTNSSIR